MACGTSVAHFSRAFKRSVGLPPHRYLLHRRIAMATRLLGEGERSLTDIALSLGFSDQSLFTRQFAALTGMTPGAARRQLRSQRDGAA
jgi:AraC-like DNA-binding protein